MHSYVNIDSTYIMIGNIWQHTESVWSSVIGLESSKLVNNLDLLALHFSNSRTVDSTCSQFWIFILYPEDIILITIKF